MTKQSGSVGNGTVLWEIDHRGVGTVTLNRPEVNNAYNGDMIRGLHEAMDTLGAMPNLRIVVMKGNGRHFQAGADLAWINAEGKKDMASNIEASRATGEAVRRLNELPIPTVAAIQGGCFGGGTGIAAACDIVIAADNAIFAITESRWGLAASIIFPQLIQAIGLRNVRRYALTSERISPEEAVRIGFAHEVCPLDELDAAVEKVVDNLMLCGPEAIKNTKTQNMQIAQAIVNDELFNDLVLKHANTRKTEEASEGTRSFLEKRKPSWYIAKD